MTKITKKKAAALGLTARTIGKKQARKEFFRLIDSLSSANAAVEITDHGKTVAVLLSYQNYVALTTKAYVRASGARSKAPDLVGSILINTDLDSASANIAAKFKTSVNKSANRL